MESVLYFENRSQDPCFNAAFEEYLFTHFPGEEIFLLWRNRPTVVFGCYQNVFAEICYPAVREKGIAIIRRSSGGGTVYHDEGNLNYTVIRPIAAKQKTDYDSFLTPMIRALRTLGVPAEQGRLCDIAINGRKISGSAQKTAGNVVLHHGTLLYNTDLKMLHAVTERRWGGTFQTKGIRSSPWPVTNICLSQGAQATDIETFAAHLREAYLPSDASFVTPTPSALREIEETARQKYANWEWTFGHTPAFTFYNRITPNDSPLDITYTAQRGIITSFSATDIRGATRNVDAFVGCRLSLSALQAACRAVWGKEETANYLL